ncbi:MAG: hypothetical protein V3S30_10295 [Thermoanaerobaculia bacterium]
MTRLILIESHAPPQTRPEKNHRRGMKIHDFIPQGEVYLLTLPFIEGIWAVESAPWMASVAR